MPVTAPSELRVWLEDVMQPIVGASTAITHVETQRSPYASSYDAQIVRVHLDTGAELKLFLKDFGACDFPKDERESRRERERRMYEEILEDAHAGTARCHGSLWDRSRARFWLLLEFVDGRELRETAFEHWVTASGWLGGFHARFARDIGAVCSRDFLVRHDAAFYLVTAERALRDVAQVSCALAERLTRALADFSAMAARMDQQPQTLLHGHYRPCNILIDLSARPARVCPVDWEQAAIGSGWYDLALLADGFDQPRLDCLIDAYRQQALGQHHALPDRDEIGHLLRAFQLFHAVKRLSQARARGLSLKEVTRTVALIERLTLQE